MSIPPVAVKITGDSEQFVKAAKEAAVQSDALKTKFGLLVDEAGRLRDENGKVVTATAQMSKEIKAAGVDVSFLAKSAKDTALASSALKGGMGSLGNAARGASMQLSQVAQQTMATGNFVQALAIQLPDIGLAFGAVGTAVGVLAGVALPLLMTALGDTSGKAQALKDALEGLSEASANFRTAVDNAKQSFPELFEQFGAGAMQVDALYERMTRLEEAAARLAFSGAISGLNEQISSLGIHGTRDGLRGIIDDFNMTRDSALTVWNAMVQLESAKGPEAQAKAADWLATAMAQAEYNTGGATQAAIDFGTGAANAAIEAARIEKNTLDAKAAVDALSGVDVTSGITAAANEAARLAKNLYEAMKATSNMPALPSRSEVDAALPAQAGVPAAPAVATTPAVVRRGGGGKKTGGGGENTALTSLVEDLKTEEETLTAWYQKSLGLLTAASDAELAALGGKAAAIERLEQEHQARLAGIRDAGNAAGLSSIATYGADALSILSAAFSGSKKLAIASALVNTYTGATEALKLPFPQNLLAFGRTMATGMQAVKSIRSTSSSGTSAGGSAVSTAGSTSSSTASSSASSSPVQVSLNTIGSGDLVSLSNVKPLIAALNAAHKDGYIINI